MNGNNQQGFPGFAPQGVGAPVGAPAPYSPQPGAPPLGADAGGFVLDFDADPTWQPFETTDVLEKDGYYCCRITKEQPRQDGNKTPGVFLTLEVVDQDAAGKTLSKFMTDPRHTKSNTWFVWRNLFLSITGNIEQARAQFRYVPGTLTNQYCYVKTAAYLDNSNEMRTGVDSFATKQQWEEATKAGRHRWAAKPKGATAQLPTGLPGSGGFPGGGFPGLPGTAGAPVPTAPAAAPPGFPPVQSQQPQAQPQPQQPALQAVPPPAQNAQTPQPPAVPSVLQGFPQRT